MSLPATNLIALSEAKERASLVQHEGVEAMLRAAMKSTRNHWMQTDEGEQFRAAVGAVMLLTEGADREGLEVEMKSLNALGALMSGLPIDIERIPVPENPVGLRRLWDESA